jgi:putative transposase
MNELSSAYGIHANQISQWKKQLQDKAATLFSGSNTNGDGHDEKTIAKLYEEIGRLKVELDWLKKRV